MTERTDFLYPFLGGDGDDPTALLDDLAASAVAKSIESETLQASSSDAMADAISATAGAMAQRFVGGGRLFTFGNGGSSTDAAGIAELFRRPPIGQGRPARCLVDDQAVLTALGNDVGFDLVFVRQLIAHAGAADIAMGVSTSGNSRNVLLALEHAAQIGMLTVALSGYDGGEMAASDSVEHSLVVRADSVHRIQESQSALSFELWAAVREQEVEDDR